MGLVILAIPGSPGGAGIGELGFGLLYGWFGYGAGLGQLSTLVQRLLSWVVALVGFVVYTRMKAGTKPATEKEGEYLVPKGQLVFPEPEVSPVG